MITVIKLFEERFWIPLTLSLLLGLFFPSFGRNFSFLVIPLLMLMFFLACLKIDFLNVVAHFKKPLFLLYILILYLIIIPVLFYALFKFINPEIAIGMLLLSAIPPGSASPAVTDIFKGNTSLSIAIAVAAYLVSPFTVLFLLFVLAQKIIHLDLGNLFKTLHIVNFIPLIASQIVRKIGKNAVLKTTKYYSFINILACCVINYIVVSTQANQIMANPFSTFVDILWLHLLFIATFIITYFAVFWRKKTDRIAVAVSKTYMNNALAIGIAVAFFSPRIALFMVLSEIPWSSSPGILKLFTDFHAKKI